MRKTLLLLVPAVLLSGCTWGITPTPASQNVRTAWNSDVSACRDLGKITVSVLNHVGPVDRNDIKVRDELQVMARNQAATMHADTIKPLGEPSNGEQAWGAYQCGTRALAPAAGHAPAGNPPDASSETGGTKTYPIGG
ncbi:DUF4156 domain-containing protein [Rhodanobacter sp. 115]|uniref:DUF4156 domain-containing protein n=1 Tax=Rhodanobacter sp. FW021-MT20 TaxID=1162282 RepID=UPI000260F4FF|nr:DUF4156 domain-containing protein [Rhodanobacter sp. 115]EIL89604.1 hypothetical protein UU5_15573 [Rhodanobacter sp. 115]